MKTTRREMIRLGLGSSTLLAYSATVPTVLARSASAMADKPKRDADGRILVVVQLDGGNDGLNTVVPYGDDLYRKNRPKLALAAKDLKPIDDHIGLHSSLDGFAKLREEGRLAIVQSVGYPNPNRSHFESMAIWQTARPDPGPETPGWLARVIDFGPNVQGGDARTLHIAAESLPQALRGGSRHLPSSLATIEQFRRRLGVTETSGANEQRAALDRIAGIDLDAENPLLQFLSRSSVVSYASSARLETVIEHDDPSSKYPEEYGLAKRLKLLAGLIRAGMTTSIYYTQLGGFDTHAEQLNRHSAQLLELGSSLKAFLADLDRSGDADRVTVLVFSEFGRRLRENAGAGTDHGTAAPLFVLGKPVRGGLYGPYPDLSRLDDGDPVHAIDFRQVYATLLERWLGLPAERTLGGSFKPLAFLG